MISLEQIRQLETRVHTAVERIQTLNAENTALKENLGRYEERIAELEKLVSAFKSEQEEIEAGIVSVLSQLDALEDSVSEGSAETAVPSDDAGGTGGPVDESDPADETDPPTSDISDDEPDNAAQQQSGYDPEAGDVPPGEVSQADSHSQPDVEEDSSPDEEEPELDIF